jgi:hypothetical protein
VMGTAARTVVIDIGRTASPFLVCGLGSDLSASTPP